MIKIKICGITNLNDAFLCENLGFDALGFVFAENSKRFINPEMARDIILQLNPFTMKIGVFTTENVDYINKVANFVGLNAVQLYTKNILIIENVQFPKILSVSQNNIDIAIKLIDKYKILLDTQVDGQVGGTGKTFNWEILPAEFRSKVILAGGLNSENIVKAYELGYRNFDLSSSVEVEKGKKDNTKLEKLKNVINYLKG
ncbi:MAG TPA: phosphoribosylanthranilate isomerase [Ignavibacteriales bacterium]|nr:phosphoribosylanthranilate isomerase [Ignavibacteriales bacterium]